MNLGKDENQAEILPWRPQTQNPPKMTSERFMLASLRCRGLAIALLMAFIMAKGAFWFPLPALSSSEPKRVCACTGSPVCSCAEGSCCKATPDPIQPETSETGLVQGTRLCGSLSQGGAIGGEVPMMVSDPVCLVKPPRIATPWVEHFTPPFLSFSDCPDPPPPKEVAKLISQA